MRRAYFQVRRTRMTTRCLSEQHTVLAPIMLLIGYRARKDFAAVVQPLLEVLQDYTGLYCTIIAGVALPRGPQEFFLKVYVLPALRAHACASANPLDLV